MKVSHTEIQPTAVEVTDDILCNKCGNSCVAAHPGWAGLLEAKVDCGYASKLGEDNVYIFSLCETCLGKLFASFKLPVTVNNEFACEEKRVGKDRGIW